MNSAIERLLTLRVCDVMRPDVVTIEQQATMGQAAAVLEQHQISGAPVVDQEGACVGVISSSDFVHRERQLAASTVARRFGFDSLYVKGVVAPVYVDTIQEELVRAHMSPMVQTVGEQTPILNAARILCNEHIHRLIVVDESKRPIGILSSLDLVACTIAAVEE